MEKVMTVKEIIDELNTIPKREQNREVSVVLHPLFEAVGGLDWMDCSDGIVLFISPKIKEPC